MTWVRLDDEFAEHPKPVTAGPLATALHVAALCWSARWSTDGFIPAGIAAKLGNFDAIEVEVNGKVVQAKGNRDAEIRRLRVARMWEASSQLCEKCSERFTEALPPGYVLHDFLDYNPSKVEVLEEKAKRAAAGRIGGRASAQARGQAHRSAPAATERRAPAEANRSARAAPPAQHMVDEVLEHDVDAIVGHDVNPIVKQNRTPYPVPVNPVPGPLPGPGPRAPAGAPARARATAVGGYTTGRRLGMGGGN